MGQASTDGQQRERADFSIVVQKEAVQKAAEGFEEHSNAAAAKAWATFRHERHT
jgi:hypothetical protein